MKESKGRNMNKSGTWVNFQIDSETNDWLTSASQRSGRQKRKEAAIRLKDHLKRYQSIAELGQAIKRENEQEQDS